ncbi:MAG: hypothetical protein WC658_02055 [Candidatus Omnitrophota bacterium]
MEQIKTRSIRDIEDKIQGLDQDSMRRHILEAAKNFKSSWVELGRALYSVWKDKMFKEWGFAKFESYTSKEIGIRKNTAMKLLRSYYFLEKEEPHYLKAATPAFEAVDVLRQAKNKKMLEDTDYDNLKEQIFEKGRDWHEVRRDLTSLIRQRQELDPEEAYQKRRQAAVKRLLSTLKSLKKEIELGKLLPAELIREADKLISKLETELN